MKTVKRLSSQKRTLLFALFSGLVAWFAFWGLMGVVRSARLSSLNETDLRLIQALRERVSAQIQRSLDQIQGAELLIASTPPSAATATKALVFALNHTDSGREVHSAAVVLDERARILASRRQGGVPPPRASERRVWRRAVAALRNQKKNGKGIHYHIEAGRLEDIPALFIVSPSPSTKGYWGVVLVAENFISLDKGEVGSGDGLFLVSEPDQIVFYARKGSEFVHDAIGREFDKGLGPSLEILACCDPAAFNMVSDGKRWMSLLDFPGGTRTLRLVRVTGPMAASAELARTNQTLAGGVLVCWLVLLGAFWLLRRRRAEGSYDDPGDSSTDDAIEPPPSNTPFAALTRLGESVARGDHFREVISYGTEEAARYVGADRFFSAVYDDDLDQLFEISCSNLGDAFRAAVAIGAGELPEHIAVKERHLVEVLAVSEWEDAPEVLKNEGIASATVFPMRVGDKVVGLMALYFDNPRELHADEIDICDYIALQGAVAVSRALSLPEPSPES